MILFQSKLWGKKGLSNLQKEKELLVIDYVKSKDASLKGEIVEAYGSLVDYIARKLAFQWDDVDDLKQVGSIGLLKSLEAFDPSKEITFSTFASSNIIGEIKHYLRDKSRMVKLPRRLQEQYTHIRQFIRVFTQESGKAPTVKEIAAELGISEDAILESMEAGQVTQVVSLDKPAYSANSKQGASEHISLLDSLGIESDGDALLDRETIKQAIQDLPDRGKKIIYLRFYEGLTQKEIADRLELSQMHISRLLTDSIEILKDVLSQ